MSFLDMLKQIAMPDYEDEWEEEAQTAAQPDVPEPEQTQITVIRPERYEQAAEVVHSLRIHGAVVLDLKETPRELHTRLADYLSGAICALDARIEKISSGVWFLTKPNAAQAMPYVEPTAPDAEPNVPGAEPTASDVEPTMPDAEPAEPDVEPTATVSAPVAPDAEANQVEEIASNLPRFRDDWAETASETAQTTGDRAR